MNTSVMWDEQAARRRAHHFRTRRSQIRAVWSSLPVAMRWPSGLQSTASVCFTCPASVLQAEAAQAEGPAQHMQHHRAQDS